MESQEKSMIPPAKDAKQWADILERLVERLGFPVIVTFIFAAMFWWFANTMLNKYLDRIERLEKQQYEQINLIEQIKTSSTAEHKEIIALLQSIKEHK